MTKEEKEKIEQLELEVNGDLPEYIKILSPKVIKVRCSNWESSEWYVFTPEDIKRYYQGEVNSLSGLRTLGSLSGDWRPINNLAENLKELFIELGSLKLKKV